MSIKESRWVPPGLGFILLKRVYFRKENQIKILHVKRKCNPADTNHSCEAGSSRRILWIWVCASHTGPRAWVSVGVWRVSDPFLCRNANRYLCSCLIVLSLPHVHTLKIRVSAQLCVCMSVCTGNILPLAKPCPTSRTSTITHLLTLVSWPNWLEPCFYWVLFSWHNWIHWNV